MLKRYFDRMAGVVVEHGGLVNKYGGDSLLAVFGTPLNPSRDHAARAVAAALQMEQALAEFNREQAAAYLPEIMVGIGIATGDVIAAMWAARGSSSTPLSETPSTSRRACRR
jgi:adenylate cyclase